VDPAADDQQQPSGVSTRRLEPGDAGGLVRCFQRCYGPSYPHGSFYDPEALARRVESGSLRSVIAVAHSGEIVGHTGLTLRDPQARVVEAGNTIVDPDFRGSGVLRRLGAALVERCQEEGFAGFIHYPTTAHEVMQKTSIRFGGVETGVMLAYVPAATDYLEVEVRRPARRLAATVVYQPIGSLSERQVVLPERHAELLERLYGELRAPRTRGAAREPKGRSAIQTSHGPREGLLRLSIDAVGEDLGGLIDALPAAQSAAPVAQADLRLDDPGVEHAVEALSGRGFLYGGLIPEFAGCDVLRLQRLSDPAPSAFSPQLANQGARRLLDYINQERAG
jgi:GNAT superfamily N-acetyltransferase